MKLIMNFPELSLISPPRLALSVIPKKALSTLIDTQLRAGGDRRCSDSHNTMLFQLTPMIFFLAKTMEPWMAFASANKLSLNWLLCSKIHSLRLFHINQHKIVNIAAQSLNFELLLHLKLCSNHCVLSRVKNSWSLPLSTLLSTIEDHNSAVIGQSRKACRIPSRSKLHHEHLLSIAIPHLVLTSFVKRRSRIANQTKDVQLPWTCSFDSCS